MKFHLLFAICYALTDLLALGQEYQALRVQKGHFDDKSRNPAVDRYNGPKHTVMKELGTLLATETAQKIIEIMGQPDEITAGNKGKGIPRYFPPANVNVTGYIYYWRNTHDFLYFIIEQNSQKSLESRWWNAFE